MSTIVTRKLRSMRVVAVGLAACVVGLAAMPTRATTITIRDTNPATFGGATGTGDKSILRNLDADYSNFTLNFVGAYGGGAADGQTRRTLLRFDISGLAGLYSQINSITLNLYPYLFDDGSNGVTTGWTNTLQVFKIDPANAAWTESNKAGSTAGAGDSSWQFQVHPSTAWAGGTGANAGLSVAGTDYDSTALVTALYGTGTVVNTDTGGISAGTPLGGGLGFGGSSASLTALINTWLTPGQNAGLFLRASDETTGTDTLMRLNTAEVINENYRPALVIDYTEIPEPASLGLVVLGAATMLCRRGRLSA